MRVFLSWRNKHGSHGNMNFQGIPFCDVGPEDTARKLHLYSTQSCVWNIPEGYLGLLKTGENPRILGFIIIFPSFSSFFLYGHGRHGFWGDFAPDGISASGLAQWIGPGTGDAICQQTWGRCVFWRRHVIWPDSGSNPQKDAEKYIEILLERWCWRLCYLFFWVLSWSIQQGWYSQWNQRVMGDISHNWRWNNEPETTPTFRAWSQNAFNLKQEPQDCSSGFLIGIGFMFDVFF